MTCGIDGALPVGVVPLLRSLYIISMSCHSKRCITNPLTLSELQTDAIMLLSGETLQQITQPLWPDNTRHVLPEKDIDSNISNNS